MSVSIVALVRWYKLWVFDYTFYKETQMFYKSESHNYNHYDVVSMYFPKKKLSTSLLRWHNFNKLKLWALRGFQCFFSNLNLVITIIPAWGQCSFHLLCLIIHHTAAVVRWYNFTSCNSEFYKDEEMFYKLESCNNVTVGGQFFFLSPADFVSLHTDKEQISLYF